MVLPISSARISQLKSRGTKGVIGVLIIEEIVVKHVSMAPEIHDSNWSPENATAASVSFRISILRAPATWELYFLIMGSRELKVKGRDTNNNEDGRIIS